MTNTKIAIISIFLLLIIDCTIDNMEMGTNHNRAPKNRMFGAIKNQNAIPHKIGINIDDNTNARVFSIFLLLKSKINIKTGNPRIEICIGYLKSILNFILELYHSFTHPNLSLPLYKRCTPLAFAVTICFSINTFSKGTVQDVCTRKIVEGYNGYPLWIIPLIIQIIINKIVNASISLNFLSAFPMLDELKYKLMRISIRPHTEAKTRLLSLTAMAEAKILSEILNDLSDCNAVGETAASSKSLKKLPTENRYYPYPMMEMKI